MRQSVLYIAVAILVVATGILLISGGSGDIAGLAPARFADAAYLSIFALLIGASLAFGRHRINARLWHIAVWLAVFLALAAGYRWFHQPPTVVVPNENALSTAV
jgi:predicted aspartyl protease